MMAEPPIMLCLKNVTGEEVSLQINPGDDFQVFLTKAKSLLGYDVDINSVTNHQPVALTDSIYRFLLSTEQPAMPATEQMPSNEGLYILDDGTQICASQIHFENEDPHFDLTYENIPFVRYNDLVDESDIAYTEYDDRVYKIDSPVRNDEDFLIPFKIINSHSSGFEAQFSKYVETNYKTYATLSTVTNRNKSPRSLIRDNFKNYNDNRSRNEKFTHYTREEILNMFKDSPVASFENQFTEKRRHARKSDLTRFAQKKSKPVPYMDVDGILIAESDSQNCFVCNKYFDNALDKQYIFDNEDQRLHRSSPQKKMSTQLKIVCEDCLNDNFKPCRMKSPNQSLNLDEVLVIRNNQQYIYQKTNDLIFCVPYKNVENPNETDDFYSEKDKSEFVKVEIGSDGEIVTKPVTKVTEDVVLVKDEKGDSSDVEIVKDEQDIENNFDKIDIFEESDEEVIQFLGKCQGGEELKELKCRFCDRIFKDMSEVVDHGDVHKHPMDDGDVYPCPLCDYGYANSKYLKGHLKAAHDKFTVDSKNNTLEDTAGANENIGDKDMGSPIDASSPIAKRTRSSKKNIVADSPKEIIKIEDDQSVTQLDSKFIVKTEIKQEVIESSDDEIWIVHTADEEGDQQLKILLDAAKNDKGYSSKKHQCVNCRQSFLSARSLRTHRCKKLKKQSNEDDNGAKGKSIDVQDSGDDMLLRPRKRRNKIPTSDPKVVTCHNCNESFTSKVRLKFHMRFHEQNNMMTPSGEFRCEQCPSQTFATETELFDHVHFRHDKQKRWRCTVPRCGKTFYLRATLTKHSRTHTDTRRYVCGTCGKRFLDKQTLDEHGVTHLQTKPFQCHICFKHLTRRSRLRMHLRAHEEELNPRLVLVCAVCSRAFRDENDVQEHATRSKECLEEADNDAVAKEEQTISMQLSPTSGVVRHTMQLAPPGRTWRVRSDAVCTQEAKDILARVASPANRIACVVYIDKAFRCEFCEDVFYSEDGLNCHRFIHKGVKNPFTCHICKVSFATYSRCTTHKTTHGFYKRPLAAAKQGAGSSSPQAGPSSTGILGYGDFPVVKHFLCEDCGRSYLHWTYLQVHRRMKHTTDNTVHKCKLCDMSFVNSWSLSYHRKKVHAKTELENNVSNNNGNTGNNENTVITTNKTRTTTDYRIPCRDCEQILPNKSALYKHRKKEHSDTGKTSGDGMFWCGYCRDRFVTRESLQVHAQSHCTKKPGSTPLTCPICATTFPTFSAYTSHCDGADPRLQAETHTQADPQIEAESPPLPHACCGCGSSFRTQSMLAEHRRVHIGERPFPCDVCGVAFTRLTAMRNHRLIHTGGLYRPWVCSRCPKSFRIKSDLRTHLRLKHPASLVVIEVSGLNPTPEQVMEKLTANHIAHDKVIEITKITFPKGTTSIIPNSFHALEMLSHIPRTQVACSRSKTDRTFEIYEPTKRSGIITKNIRKPKILQRGEKSNIIAEFDVTTPTNVQCAEQVRCSPQIVTSQAGPSHASLSSVTYNTNEDLSEINLQLLLKDGVLVNGNQMEQMEIDETLLQE